MELEDLKSLNTKHELSVEVHPPGQEKENRYSYGSQI